MLMTHYGTPYGNISIHISLDDDELGSEKYKEIKFDLLDFALWGIK